MRPSFVLVGMREAQESNFEPVASATPPRGLFSRIIRRLGLEIQIFVVKEHLSVFVVLLIVFVVLSVFAVIGLKYALAKSGFGPYLSLVFSDPGAVIKYWHSFILSVFESMPSSMIFLVLLGAALILLAVRLICTALEKLFSLKKSISRQLHGNR